MAVGEADILAERMEPGNVLKQELFGIISWVVFLSTIVHGKSNHFMESQQISSNYPWGT